MNTRDSTAHQIMQLVRQGVRDELKLQTTGRATAAASFVGFTGGTALGQTVDGGVAQTASSSAGAAQSAGTDYSLWPLAALVFDSFEERFANLEQFVAVAFVTAMRGDPATGHRHTGADGDGPPLPATAVLLPVGSVGSGTTLADHLTNASLHAGSGRAIVYDDFEDPDQAGRWEIRAGVPALDATGGNTRWHLPAGTVLRVKHDLGYCFNQKLTVRFDLTFDAGAVDRRFEVRYRVRPTAAGFSYVAGFSTSQSCYLAELDNTTGLLTTEASGGQLPNDGLAWTYEATLGHTDFRSDLGAALNQTLTYTIPRADSDSQGYLEFYAVGPVWLDNVLIARTASAPVAPHAAQHKSGGLDPLDIADLADRDGHLTAGGTPGLHAATHRAGGSDALDIGDLLDAGGTRLSSAQKSALTMGGSADGYHTHTGLLSLEGSVAPAANQRAAVIGGSPHAAHADHGHVQPHWDLDWYLAPDFTPGYLVTDGDFDTSPRSTVRKSFQATFGGEFRYNGYGSNLYLRARLKVNNTGADRVVTFIVPALLGTMKVRLLNSVGDTTLYSRTASLNRANETFTATLKGGEVNTLVVMGGANVDQWAFHLGSAETNGDVLDASKSLFYQQ